MYEKELEQFTDLKKLDDFLKVMSFFHVEICENDDCSQLFLL